MNDLIDFLRARYTEIARYADDIHAVPCESLPGDPDDTGHGLGPQSCSCGHPARVLADIESKRQIVESAEYFLHNDERGPDPMSALALRHLAAPHAGHPDFQEAWRV